MCEQDLQVCAIIPAKGTIVYEVQRDRVLAATLHPPEAGPDAVEASRVRAAIASLPLDVPVGAVKQD